jgi:prepilin-type N-terminal cleavage/methylation domain-containing protein
MLSRRQAAFTLVEIMIVVSVIALLAMIALPSFLRARQRAQNTQFINSLRVARDAFELYAVEHNDYPPNALPGTLPPGMESYFGPSFDFSAPTPIGGSWDWVNRKVGTLIGVSVFSPTVDSAQLEEIDAIIDDGDLSHGAFTRPGSDRLVLSLE